MQNRGNLTIQEVLATPVSVPLAHPVRTASGTVTHAPMVLIDLRTSQGVVGVAYLFCYTPAVLQPLAKLVEAIGATLNGPVAPIAIEAQLDARFRLLGNTGLVTMALAGIDMAAWDALARAAEMPLSRFLGGGNQPVPAYFSQGMDGLERGVELAGEAARRSFKAMKIKIGYPTLEEDIAVVRAVQEALEGRVQLFVDYNQSLSVPEAMRRCRALDDLGISWIEEPTRQDDYAGHAAIAAQVRTPIQLGENWFGVHEMARSVAAKASDLAMIDIMKIGGVTGWLRAASVAHTARLPVSSHIFQEFSVHLLSGAPTTHWLEYLDLAAPVLKEPLELKDGNALVPERPGSGIAWNDEAVARFRVQ
jgi:mandelate racemase